MKAFLLAVALMAAVPAFSAEKPPSEASIRELLEVSNAKNLLEGMYKQVDGMLDQMLKQSQGDKPLNEAQQKLAAEMRSKVVDLLKTDLSWDALEPIYIKLYTDTFSQSDINGILKFYKTPAGNSLLKKMPLLMQNLMQTMVTQMQSLIPKVRAVAEEYAPLIAEAGK